MSRPGGRPVVARVRAVLRPRTTRGQVLAAVLCALLGFALVVQVRSTGQDGIGQVRAEDLAGIYAQQGEQLDRLHAEQDDLEATLSRLRSASDQRAAALALTRERVDDLAVLAGTAPAHGPGVVLTIGDPGGRVSADLLVGAVQELRAARAEAISVGDARVVASTAFVDGTGGMEVGGTEVRPPYVVRAIGDPQTIESALRIPGGVVATLETVQATADVEQRDDVVVDALAATQEPAYAHPVEPQDGSD